MVNCGVVRFCLARGEDVLVWELLQDNVEREGCNDGRFGYALPG